MKTEILQAYDSIAVRFDELIDHKPHNAYYDRPNMMKLIGNCDGKMILDAACGPGKYAEELMGKGASVTGFDLSSNMIEQARKRNPDKGHFFVHDLDKPLTTLSNHSFDVVVCALALHYIPDWNHAIQEFHRVLKTGGKLVISIEHPFFEYDYFKSDKYFEVEPVQCTWRGLGKPVIMNSYRRPLSECIAPLVNNGFLIDQIIEPRPVAEFERLDPKHFNELNNFPAFMCISAVSRNSNHK